MLSGPPTPLSTQHRFRPSHGPTTSPAVATYRARRPGRWQAGPAHRVTRSRDDVAASSPTFVALADNQSQRRARRPRALPSRRAAHLPAHPSRPRVPRCYKSRRRAPGEIPTLAASGSCSPVHPSTRWRRRERRGEKEEWSRPWKETSAAKTGAARGRSRTRRRRERLLPLLPLLPLRLVAAFLFFLLTGKPHNHTTPSPALRPVATKVRTTASLPMWTPRPSSRGGTCSRTAPPRLRASACDAGLLAKLGQLVCRCRCLRRRALALLAYPLLVAVDRCALPLASAAPRRAVHARVRVRARSHADPTSRALVHPSTRARQSRGQNWILVPRFLSRRTRRRV
jgi:hypothetical protein